MGGGSNAMGVFYPYIPESAVRLIGVEAAGEGIASGHHAATLCAGRPGVLHGNRTYLLQDAVTSTIVFNERAESVASYNVLTQRFSTVVAEDEARRRAAELIADEMVLQVSLFLNRRHAPATPAAQ